MQLTRKSYITSQRVFKYRKCYHVARAKVVSYKISILGSPISYKPLFPLPSAYVIVRLSEFVFNGTQENSIFVLKPINVSIILVF